jgi:LacI family transcriptional regulator
LIVTGIELAFLLLLMATRRASITDLAAALNLSPSTISRALSNHKDVSEATKQRVRALAAELHYQPNQLAAALRRGRSKMLGVLVPHIQGHFFPEVVHGITVAASKAGYQVLICQSNEDVAQERQHLDLFMTAQVEGILVSLAETTQDFFHFEQVRDQQVPLVFFDRAVEGFEGEQVRAVVLDDYQGAYQATAHLIGQGCRRIAHLCGPLHLGIHKNRHQGYLDALAAHGLAAEDDLTVLCEMNQRGGTLAARQLLKLATPPDAIFSSNDLAVVGALQVLKKHKRRVPQDVALVGFSNEAFTALTEPQLSTVDQCCGQMGQTAVRLLLQMIQRETKRGAAGAAKSVVLKPKLIVRESSERR